MKNAFHDGKNSANPRKHRRQNRNADRRGIKGKLAEKGTFSAFSMSNLGSPICPLTRLAAYFPRKGDR